MGLPRVAERGIRLSKPWNEQVIAGVNTRLKNFLAEKRAQAQALTPKATELVDAVEQLTMRGGKRLRAMAIYAGYRAVAAQPNDAGFEGALDLGAAIELLQTYLLIQDDWMDDDDQRRGGPATHAAFARQYGDAKLGASLAILAGDFAAGFAFELLHATHFPAATAAQARDAFTRMHFEVVAGQQLDLLGHDEVTLTQHLKTGSYTVRGPVTLGALLGGANAEQLAALERFARPLGIAFQLRDDLLGTFGDTRSTGKPAGHDLREGKQTALVYEARKLLDASDRARLDDVLGRASASAEALAEVAAILERSGVRARVEAQLQTQLNEAQAALQSAPLVEAGVGMLNQLLQRIAQRDR
jgi:geranylgeranyl diphosphate synthase type I